MQVGTSPPKGASSSCKTKSCGFDLACFNRCVKDSDRKKGGRREMFKTRRLSAFKPRENPAATIALVLCLFPGFAAQAFGHGPRFGNLMFPAKTALAPRASWQQRSHCRRIVPVLMPNRASTLAHMTKDPVDSSVVDGQETRRGAVVKPAAVHRSRWHPWDILLQLTLPDLPLLLMAFVALAIAAIGEALMPKLQGAALNHAIGLAAPGAHVSLPGLEYLQQTAGLQQALTSLAATGVATAVFTGIRGCLFWLCGARLVARLRLVLFQALLQQPQAFFDTQSAGELASRLATDCVKLGDVLSLNINIVARQTLQSTIALGIVINITPRLAVLVVTGLLLRSLIASSYAAVIGPLARAQQTQLAASSGVAEQCLSLIRVVRAHNTEASEGVRYRSVLHKLLHLQSRQGVLYGLSRVANGSLSSLLMTSVITYGAMLVAAGVIAGSELTSFILYVLFISEASADVGDQWGKVQEALGAATDVFDYILLRPIDTSASVPTSSDAAAAAAAAAFGTAFVLDGPGPKANGPQTGLDRYLARVIRPLSFLAETLLGNSKHKVTRGEDLRGEGSAPPLLAAASSKLPNAVQPPSGAALLAQTPLKSEETRAERGPGGGEAEVLVFENVSFAYPSRPSRAALLDVSLRIRSGQSIAVVGASGCGKSTLFALALRFYAPSHGRVVLDGRDLASVEEGQLRSAVAWVPQEPPIFANMSIRDNIAYGCARMLSARQLEAAARASNADGFIRLLPEGLDTRVGAAGSALSGGQKQRIALARAVAREARVLLLDEPTSALDTASSAHVEACVLRAKAGQSVLYTTHKLAQARLADVIFVMERGRIVEQGSHEQLLARRGEYARMIQAGLGGDKSRKLRASGVGREEGWEKREEGEEGEEGGGGLVVAGE